MGEQGGLGPQKFAYQKWPDQIFPAVNIVLSHDSHFGLRGGVQGGGYLPSSLRETIQAQAWGWSVLQMPQELTPNTSACGTSRITLQECTYTMPVRVHLRSAQ